MRFLNKALIKQHGYECLQIGINKIKFSSEEFILILFMKSFDKCVCQKHHKIIYLCIKTDLKLTLMGYVKTIFL